jgi:argininosuccinate lyase
MKGQPLAYNKDNQEDKEPLFDIVRTLRDCTVAFADLIPAIEAKRDNMRAAASKGYATATDLADYLVRKGLPFRDAHDVVGKLVAVAIRMNCDLAELPLTTLQEGSGLVEADVLNALSLDGSVAARNHVGGTAPNQVRAAIARALAAHPQ